MTPYSGGVSPTPPQNQPKSGAPKKATTPPPPATNYHLVFLAKGFPPQGTQGGFEVLCGDNPPTITDGYSKWSIIDRPLRTGVLQWQGANPAQMVCDLRFGTFTDDFGWNLSDGAAKTLEDDISTLDWMAGGRLRLHAAHPSPIVEVFCPSTKGGQTDLVPKDYQSALSGKGYLWVITSLQWGKSLRNENARRVWQEATVTLTQYVAADNSKTPIPSAVERGGYFKTSATVNTPRKIAASPSSHSPTAFQPILAERIVRHPKNKALKLKKIDQPIKPNKKVWVPAHDKA